MKKVLLMAVLSLALVSVVQADIAPALVGPGPFAGEASLVYGGVPVPPPGVVGYVDWLVYGPGATGLNPTEWLYVFELESDFADLNILTVNAVNVNAAGHTLGGFTDIDAAPFGHVLGGEAFEDAGAVHIAPSATSVATSNVTWTFAGGIDAGEASSTLWFTSDYGPRYDFASTQDTLPNSGGLGRVPSPVPVPGAVLLVGIGLGLVGWCKRRFA